MRALLDINVLIALFDGDHVHHKTARAWLAANIDAGWASCPITQNGLVRILSQPAYPQPVSTAQAIQMLRAATSRSHHEFWADSISLLAPERIVHDRLHGPRQLTDAYLLALAVEHGGCFVSFDRTLPLSVVRGATPKHVVLL